MCYNMCTHSDDFGGLFYETYYRIVAIHNVVFVISCLFAGLDPDENTGFYVNIGLDRLVMMRYGVDDVRLFHSGDLRFLRQFR